jgi:hypothetical protein
LGRAWDAVNPSVSRLAEAGEGGFMIQPATTVSEKKPTFRFGKKTPLPGSNVRIAEDGLR